MQKYSVEISHDIITYYKRKSFDQETGEPIVKRSKSVKPIKEFDVHKDFDNFTESVRWIDSEIINVLNTIWTEFPGKHVYLSKSICNATLDIKLSNYGWPKTVYRITFKGGRNKSDEDKPGTKVVELQLPPSEEHQKAFDDLKLGRRGFRNELESLKEKGLLTELWRRRAFYQFTRIYSILSKIVCDDEEYSKASDDLKNINDELISFYENHEGHDYQLYIPEYNKLNLDSAISIVKRSINTMKELNCASESTLALATDAIQNVENYAFIASHISQHNKKS